MMTPETGMASGPENNNCETGETYGGIYDKTDSLGSPSPHTVIDMTGDTDTACIQITETSVTSSPGSRNGTDNGSTAASEEDSMDGFPLKRAEIRKSMKHIHHRAWSNIGLAFLRNLLTWACAVSLIVIIANASRMQYWDHNQIAAVVCIFGIGLFGVGFHVFRSYMDLSFKYPTVIAKLLRDALSREEFIRLVQNRQMSPPEISVEVALKSGAMSSEHVDHWTRSSSRSTRREILYRGWADQSEPVSTFVWPEGRSAWLCVGKDFRSIDRNTKSRIESEVAEFRKETGYDANRYYMNLKFLLQWKESDSCDDAEMFLVFEDVRPGFYFLELYQACTLIAMDSVYRAIFHCVTRNLNDYYIVKFIEK